MTMRWFQREDGLIRVDDIQGDMGETTRLTLIVQTDGDVIIMLTDRDEPAHVGIEFCANLGGGRDPEITRRLRELAHYIIEAHPEARVP